MLWERQHKQRRYSEQKRKQAQERTEKQETLQLGRDCRTQEQRDLQGALEHAYCAHVTQRLQRAIAETKQSAESLVAQSGS